MIDREHELAVGRQAALLQLSRSSLYYEPRPVSPTILALMRRIDELHLNYPFAGSRMLRDMLRADGVVVGRELVTRLMRRMRIEAIYRRPNTSKPAAGHKIYPYLLRKLVIDRPNQVWATDITYIPMARGFVYLAAVVDWFTRRVLAWRLSITMEADFCIEAVEEALARNGKPEISARCGASSRQHRSGKPIHQFALHWAAAETWHCHQHGRSRRLARQRLCRAPVAIGEIRGGCVL